MPEGVEALDAALKDAQIAAQAAKDEERLAQAADAAARKARGTARDRGPLEQVRRDHAEQRRLLADIPAATADLDAAASRLEQATQQVETSARDVDTARDARDAAALNNAAALAKADRLTAELGSLAAVALPPGVLELDQRTRSVHRVLQDAIATLNAAEKRDTEARAALQRAPRQAPLEHALHQIAELTEATLAVGLLQTSRDQAATEHDHALAELDGAIAALGDAMAARDELALTNSAARLRPHLAIGDACPVCEQTVVKVPKPLRVPKLAAAEKAVTTADGKVQLARTAESNASAALAASVAQLTAAKQRVSRLDSALDGQPAEAAAIRESLDTLEMLDAEAQVAGDAVQNARTQFAAAQEDAKLVDADAADLRTALHTTRDPLVSLGAPAVDGSRLLEAWTTLTDWATEKAKRRRQARSEAESEADVTAAPLSVAEKALVDANSHVTASRLAETGATAAHERAKTTLSGLTSRLGELTVALVGAPTDADAQAQLAMIDQLTAAVDIADAELQRARSARERADDAAQALTQDARAAWQVLRKARDTLIPLSAPELPDGSVLGGWQTLIGWAREQAEGSAISLLAAEDAVVAASLSPDSITGELTEAFAALDVPIAEGEMSNTAPVAAATALTQSVAERARIVERRQRAASLSADHAEAETEQQVARMLGNLLRSDQFPEWLEAAALDTLVADASIRLAELSNGQFELTHRNGEFFVIDHADADSQRGVRTLSGGETFQASLALALSLSTQLSSMAAAGAAGLDSIFLDEGFGTLDESTLEIVAATLENLAQGDRMVGVVTHVAALAERVPVRFVVNRDSRTSCMSRETVTSGSFADGMSADSRRPRMSFSVDGWDPTYGTSLEFEETWANPPRRSTSVSRSHLIAGDPSRLLGCGSRRARRCSSTGCGGSRRGSGSTTSAPGRPPPTRPPRSAPPTPPVSVCCCDAGAHLLSPRPAAACSPSHRTPKTSRRPPDRMWRASQIRIPAMPLSVTLSSALQARLADIELSVALGAREDVSGHSAGGDDLLVIDGPLRGRNHLPRALGYIKSHRAAYLPPEQHAMIGSLAAGQRTPVFRMGTSWDRYSWYLRLPCLPSAPWAGIVRVECSPELPVLDAVALAGLSQVTLVRFASTEYKDARAPQNLYPIAGLERELRRRLGDSRLLYRALRVAAAG